MSAEGWYQTRWWRVLGPDGEIWCETSNKIDAKERMRPGDRLYELWRREQEAWVLEGERPI